MRLLVTSFLSWVLLVSIASPLSGQDLRVRPGYVLCEAGGAAGLVPGILWCFGAFHR